MHALNAIIYDLEDRTAMMTCIFGVLNMEHNTLTFSNAGHLYPYYFRAREDRLSCVESTSYPLGIRADMNFPICQVKLERGDFVLACSDGFIEAENRKSEMYGYERFERVINENRTRTATQLADAIKDDFSRFLGGQPHSDDLTLIVLRMK
jgi:sigma-B regulation protein RsbU (phosphoserine phosphatase)